jgi:hypothetical protein
MSTGEAEHEAILVVFSEPGEAVEVKEFNGESSGLSLFPICGIHTVFALD